MIIAHLINGDRVEIADINLKEISYAIDHNISMVRDDDVAVMVDAVAYFEEA